MCKEGLQKPWGNAEMLNHTSWRFQFPCRSPLPPSLVSFMLDDEVGVGKVRSTKKFHRRKIKRGRELKAVKERQLSLSSVMREGECSVSSGA